MRKKRSIGSPLTIEDAIRVMRMGRAVAYPTETFLGLGVDAMNPAAVDHLRSLKQRGQKPIAVVVANKDMTQMVTPPLSELAERLAQAFWPGPLTLILPARETVPENLRAGGPSIGVRISTHIVARALSASLGGPVTSTSCNVAGGVEPTRPERIDAELFAQFAGYVDGVAPGGLASTIVDLSGDGARLIRHGAIPSEALLKVIPELVVT